MKKYISDFLDYMLYKKNASSNTIDSYRRDLTKFLACAEKDQGSDIGNINETFILNYIMILKSEGKSSATISRTISSLRSFFGYLLNNGYIRRNPANELRSLKQERQSPRVLSDIQISAFLSAPDTSTLKGCRDSAMLELLYASGMHVSELISLTFQDIDVNAGFVMCQNKAGKHSVPIYPIARDAIKNYLKRRSEISDSDKSDILFLNLSGMPLSRQGVWKIIKKYSRICGLGQDITPNIIRNTFAVQLLKNGADIKDVQNMMGHAEIASTRVYEQTLRDKMSDAYSKAHPRANIRK